MGELPDLAIVALRLALSALALAAAVHKLRDPYRSRRATRILLGRDGVLADVAWGGAVCLEGLGAVLTATGAFGGRGSLILALVWCCYALALGRKRDAEDCGCGFGRRSPGHGFGLIRNVGLAALGAAASLRADIGIDPGTVLAAAPAALIFFLLYLAADELGSHPSLARNRS